MVGVDAQWIWVGIGLVLLIAEIATSSLVALPLALGAFAAAVVALFGGGIEVQFAAAAVVAAGSFAALRPVARRLNDRGTVEGIGSHRLTNSTAVALSTIDESGTGSVRAGAEQWHATSDTGAVIPEGTRLRVLRVEGTRLVVTPLDTTPQDTTPQDTTPQDNPGETP